MWIVIHKLAPLRAGSRPTPSSHPRSHRLRLGYDAPWSAEQARQLAADVMARANPERDLPGQGARRDLGPRVDNTKLQRGSSNVSYLAARIKRDHPDIAAAVERGEYRSMRQAAIAAGIVKPRDALRDARMVAIQDKKTATHVGGGVAAREALD
jgi:hypothetical protein